MTFLEAVAAAEQGALIRPAGKLRGQALEWRPNWPGWFLAASSVVNSSARLPSPELLRGPWETVTWEQLERERGA